METEWIWQLLAKRMSNRLTPEEANELERLQAGKDNLHGELAAGIAGLEVAGKDEATREKSWQAIKAKLGSADVPAKGKVRVITYRRIAAAAAVLLILAAGTYFLLSQKNSAAPELAFNEVSTIGGVKKQVQLPDGTVIILNRETKLRYNREFARKSREVYLEGEAYFDVTKNADMPLLVHAGKADVMVTGTVFNVKAYPGDAVMEAALISGAIAMLPHATPDRKIVLRPGEKFTMGNEKMMAVSQVKLYQAVTGGELMEVTKIKQLPKDTLVAENAWIADKMVFDAEPFSQVARRMERWYGVTITISDTSLAAMPLSGNFEKESLSQALDALKGITPFNYTVENNHVIISR